MTVRLGLAGLALALAAAAGLYTIKDDVQRLEHELRGLRATMAQERATLNRLRTELAILTQPGRIARLAAAHLRLGPARPQQIVAIDDIPLRSELDLADLRLQAPLPSGGEVPLRLKPNRLGAALAPQSSGGGQR